MQVAVLARYGLGHRGLVEGSDTAALNAARAAAASTSLRETPRRGVCATVPDRRFANKGPRSPLSKERATEDAGCRTVTEDNDDDEESWTINLLICPCMVERRQASPHTHLSARSAADVTRTASRWFKHDKSLTEGGKKPKWTTHQSQGRRPPSAETACTFCTRVETDSLETHSSKSPISETWPAPARQA